MRVVVDSTRTQLKFADFQQKYFEGSLPAEYEIEPKKICRTGRWTCRRRRRRSRSSLDLARKQ